MIDRGTPYRLPEAAREVGKAQQTVKNLLAQGKFPKPHKQGSTNVWFLDELTAYNRVNITGYDEFHTVDS